jgi:hypothetical protein
VLLKKYGVEFTFISYLRFFNQKYGIVSKEVRQDFNSAFLRKAGDFFYPDFFLVAERLKIFYA